MVIIVQLVMYMCIYLAITIRLDFLNTMVVLFTANGVVIYSDHLYNKIKIQCEKLVPQCMIFTCTHKC